MVDIAENALKSANRWLESARLNYNDMNFDIAVYSMEMSFEIGIKAVLNALHQEVPKTHYVEDHFILAVEKNVDIDPEVKSQLKSYMVDFRTLLRVRSAAGYSFEREEQTELMRTVYESRINKLQSFLKIVKSTIEGFPEKK